MVIVVAAMASAATMFISSPRARLISIGRDGDDDDDADDDLLHVVRPPHLLTTVAQEGHDQRADHGAGDAPLAAVQASAADDYGGDDVELHPHRDGRITLPQPRHLGYAGQAEKEPGHAVDPDL